MNSCMRNEEQAGEHLSDEFSSLVRYRPISSIVLRSVSSNKFEGVPSFASSISNLKYNRNVMSYAKNRCCQAQL